MSSALEEALLAFALEVSQQEALHWVLLALVVLALLPVNQLGGLHRCVEAGLLREHWELLDEPEPLTEDRQAVLLAQDFVLPRLVLELVEWVPQKVVHPVVQAVALGSALFSEQVGQPDLLYLEAALVVGEVVMQDWVMVVSPAVLQTLPEWEWEEE